MNRTFTYVSSATLRETIISATDPERFEFNARARLPWLQRPLFWLLRKLGCEAHTFRAEVTTIDLGPLRKQFIAQLMAAKEGLLDLSREPEYLLIGSQDFAELCQQPDALVAFHFDAEYYNRRRVCGLRVFVMPWMRGYVVLPKGWERYEG